MTQRTADNRLTRIKKANLPQKICATCARPFAWRKKWARDWEQVRYCSQRCQRSKGQANGAGLV